MFGSPTHPGGRDAPADRPPTTVAGLECDDPTPRRRRRVALDAPIGAVRRPARLRRAPEAPRPGARHRTREGRRARALAAPAPRPRPARAQGADRRRRVRGARGPRRRARLDAPHGRVGRRRRPHLPLRRRRHPRLVGGTSLDLARALGHRGRAGRTPAGTPARHRRPHRRLPRRGHRHQAQPHLRRGRRRALHAGASTAAPRSSSPPSPSPCSSRATGRASAARASVPASA